MYNRTLHADISTILTMEFYWKYEELYVRQYRERPILLYLGCPASAPDPVGSPIPSRLHRRIDVVRAKADGTRFKNGKVRTLSGSVFHGSEVHVEDARTPILTF